MGRDLALAMIAGVVAGIVVLIVGGGALSVLVAPTW